jgi:hypothetical protein
MISPVKIQNHRKLPYVLVLLVVFAIALIVFWIRDDPPELLAVSSLNYSTINLAEINCLSIGPHDVVVDRVEYSDHQLAQMVSEALPIKKVVYDADVQACPWGIVLTAERGLIAAVRYANRSASYLVSIAVCERTPGGGMKPDRCISKNVYVFNRRVESRQLFSVALRALARPQPNKWEVVSE